MRLQLILPRVEPEKLTPPATCPYKGCHGRSFKRWQAVDKALQEAQNAYNSFVDYVKEHTASKDSNEM